MKKFASIASVVALLLVAALYYGNQQRGKADPTPDVPPTPDPHTVVKAPTSPDAPTTHAAHAGTLSLSAASSHGYALSNQASEVYAAIDLKAIKHQGAQRPPERQQVTRRGALVPKLDGAGSGLEGFGHHLPYGSRRGQPGVGNDDQPEPCVEPVRRDGRTVSRWCRSLRAHAVPPPWRDCARPGIG